MNSLEVLARESGTRFPNLTKSRALSAAKLGERRKTLDGLGLPDGYAVVYLGSIGRSEAVSGSDDDFILLADEAAPGDKSLAILEDVKAGLRSIPDFEEPSSTGPFSQPVRGKDLAEKIGLRDDDNDNTTRRMLFFLESTHAWNEQIYDETFDQILARYIDDSVKDFRPPRFLLNDLIRYWRTMCVDFAGKAHRGPDKWGIRNAKLRTSRKMLFAGGLLPVLACAQLERGSMATHLRYELSQPPTDRVAKSFLADPDTIDAGARTLGAYDDFLGLVSDSDFRQELESLTADDAKTSASFKKVRELGKTIEHGLLSLLFKPGDGDTLSRNYLVF